MRLPRLFVVLSLAFVPLVGRADQPFRYTAGKFGKAELKYVNDLPVLSVQGTPEELKRAIAGDVVTFSVAGEQRRALDLIQGEPFVREARLENGSVHLYVDRGEQAMPAILRLLDGANLQLLTVELHRPSLDDVFLRQTGRSLRESPA